jgi:hypothetical protein
MTSEYMKYVRTLRDENLAKLDAQIEVIEKLLAKAESDEGISSEDWTIFEAQMAYDDFDRIDETGALAEGCRAGQAESYRQTLAALKRQREFLLEMSADSIQSAKSRVAARTRENPLVRL